MQDQPRQFFTAAEYNKTAEDTLRRLLAAYEKAKLARLGGHPRHQHAEVARIHCQQRAEKSKESLQRSLPTMRHRTRPALQSDLRLRNMEARYEDILARNSVLRIFHQLYVAPWHILPRGFWPRLWSPGHQACSSSERHGFCCEACLEEFGTNTGRSKAWHCNATSKERSSPLQHLCAIREEPPAQPCAAQAVAASQEALEDASQVCHCAICATCQKKAHPTPTPSSMQGATESQVAATLGRTSKRSMRRLMQANILSTMNRCNGVGTLPGAPPLERIEHTQALSTAEVVELWPVVHWSLGHRCRGVASPMYRFRGLRSVLKSPPSSSSTWPLEHS